MCEHLKHLEVVLERIQEAGLTIKVTIICRYIFCRFRILCILLVSNFAIASHPRRACAERANMHWLTLFPFVLRECIRSYAKGVYGIYLAPLGPRSCQLSHSPCMFVHRKNLVLYLNQKSGLIYLQLRQLMQWVHLHLSSGGTINPLVMGLFQLHLMVTITYLWL